MSNVLLRNNMDKKSIILLSLFLGTPLTFILVIAGGLAAGFSEPGILKLVLGVFPVFLLAIVLISYWVKECLYIRFYRYSRDTVQVAITSKNSPVLFHLLQAFLLILSIVLIGIISKLDISEFM
jgi:hypothetical protein